MIHDVCHLLTLCSLKDITHAAATDKINVILSDMIISFSNHIGTLVILI